MAKDNDEKVVLLDPRYIREARKLLKSLPDEDLDNVLRFIGKLLLEEIQRGLEGEETGPFYEAVQDMFDEAHPCYFCNRGIDGNAEEFNGDVHLCLNCTSKIANVLVACGVDHRVLFPGMCDRTIQVTRVAR